MAGEPEETNDFPIKFLRFSCNFSLPMKIDDWIGPENPAVHSYIDVYGTNMDQEIQSNLESRIWWSDQFVIIPTIPIIIPSSGNLKQPTCGPCGTKVCKNHQTCGFNEQRWWCHSWQKCRETVEGQAIDGENDAQWSEAWRPSLPTTRRVTRAQNTAALQPICESAASPGHQWQHPKWIF